MSDTNEVRVGGIWFCKIGEHSPLQRGADSPMRDAVAAEYKKLTGQEPAFIFSGWSGELTEPERAVVENRLPVREATPPADAALAENAAIDCLRACAQAMRIFDRTDTAAEVDRATDAIAAALRARTVPVMFPRQTNGEGGWTIDTNYIAAIRKDCPVEWQPCEEETEAVLLAVERERAMLAASKEDGK